MSDILLTVAIPTLTERREIFQPKLEKYYSLLKQQNLEQQVEIITYEDNREMTIGEKRNILIDKAKGSMISFVDDDDDISDDYFYLITKKIQQNKNLDAIEIICHVINKLDQRYNYYVFKGLQNNLTNNLSFKENINIRVRYSEISQLNPIKTSLVKCIKYPKIPFHEDFVFQKKIKQKIINVDSILENYIYIYNYNPLTSAVQKYRKPQTPMLNELNKLYTDEQKLLEYDSHTGEIKDTRYYDIINSNN